MTLIETYKAQFPSMYPRKGRAPTTHQEFALNKRPETVPLAFRRSIAKILREAREGKGLEATFQSATMSDFLFLLKLPTWSDRKSSLLFFHVM